MRSAHGPAFFVASPAAARVRCQIEIGSAQVSAGIFSAGPLYQKL